MGRLFETGYYSEDDLRHEGFRSLGHNVRIAKNCTIVGIENISIGNDVRIDSNCTILAQGTGWLTIGSFVHIAAYAFLAGGDGIEVADFCGLSQRACVYSRNDDYSGKYLTGPVVPEKYIGLSRGAVRLNRHVVVGSSSIILPGVTIGLGSSIGALSLVNRSLSEWGVYCGCPVRKIKERAQDLLKLEQELLSELRMAPGPVYRSEAA